MDHLKNTPKLSHQNNHDLLPFPVCCMYVSSPHSQFDLISFWSYILTNAVNLAVSTRNRTLVDPISDWINQLRWWSILRTYFSLYTQLLQLVFTRIILLIKFVLIPRSWKVIFYWESWPLTSSFLVEHNPSLFCLLDVSYPLFTSSIALK